MAKRNTRVGTWERDPIDGILRKVEKDLKALSDRCMGCGAKGVKTTDKHGHFPTCQYRKK